MFPENYGVGQSAVAQNFTGKGIAPQLYFFPIEDLSADADISARLLAHIPTGYEMDVLDAKINLLSDYSGAGTAQVETATVVGTVSTAGNASVVVTAAGMTGTPKTIPVAVALSDDASAVAGKIRAALAADTAVAAMFTVGGAAATVVLTRKIKAANDATLNVSIDNGTCAGLTTAATSANTTAGVAQTSTTIVLKNGTDTIVSKEMNDTNYPAAGSALSLGALSETYKKIAAGGSLKLDVTNAGAANPPSMVLQLLVSLDQAFE
jgi:hypothetical protein